MRGSPMDARSTANHFSKSRSAWGNRPQFSIPNRRDRLRVSASFACVGILRRPSIHSSSKFCNGAESASAILAITSRLGLRLPRSIPPT